MEQITLEPVDSVQLTTVMDNLTDLTLAGSESVERRAFGALPLRTSAFFEDELYDVFRAEHGFSAIVDIERNGTASRFMFDAGLTPDGVIENLDRMEIDPGTLEVIVLSHGHFDHTGGLDGVIRRLGKTQMPVLIHPEFWNRRRITIPGRDPIELPTTSRSALEGAGFDIVEDRQPSFLFDRSVLVTGEVDRTTQFEPGMPGQQALRNGEWVSDEETLDDQALVLNIAGKGLVVMSGCGHAGIINTVRYAQRLTGISRVYAIIGGFHLGPQRFHSIIDQTVDELVEIDPAVIVPAHCTGWKAQMRFAERLPHAFTPNSVGTTFHL
ncbi:MAG: MBL fold metallo-hydrolase [Acidimicrobiia bacterium]